MTTKAVIFDLDGTIINFNLDYKTARAEVIEYLTTQGFPRSLFSLNESVFEMLKKVEVSMRNSGKNEKEFSKLRETVLALLEKYELESAKTTSLIPGILETLKTLKQNKLKLALFTVNSKKSTNYILDTFHLKNSFDAVVTRDSVPKVKPNPVHLETALKKVKVKPAEAIVVGDSNWDMKTAQELHVFAVGVTYGISTPEELTRAGANCLISSPTDLIKLIEETNTHAKMRRKRNHTRSPNTRATIKPAVKKTSRGKPGVAQTMFGSRPSRLALKILLTIPSTFSSLGNTNRCLSVSPVSFLPMSSRGYMCPFSNSDALTL